LVGYGVAAFAVLQIFEPIMHGLRWPESTLSYVVVALALGFPLVVALAWIFDVREGRIQRVPSSAKGARVAAIAIGLGAVAAAPGLAYYLLWRTPAGSLPTTASIAVLPFTDMSPGHDQEYFSDGVAEEILNALAQVDGLRVAGRTSSFYFKGKNEDLATIAEKLRVATILEGSVRKSGNQVRITAQLINAHDGFHLWSKQYDRELTDVFKVQAELAAAVVEALKGKLLSTSNALPKISRPRDPEAYRLFALGRALYFQHGPQSLERAAEQLARAVGRDPTYAPAWALLVSVHGDMTLVAPRSEIPQRAREALHEAERAVAADADLSEAYAARGWVRGWLFWDWPGARDDLERALRLSPGSADALNNYAGFIQKSGRLSEAIALQRRAADIDPLDANNWTNLGGFLLQDGQLGAAREAFLRATDISPDNPTAASWLPYVDLLEGHPEKALEAVEKWPDGAPRLASLAIVHHALGHPRESQQALAVLVDRVAGDEPDVAFRIASVHAWRGEADKAFEWLERAYERRELALRLLRVSIAFRDLRGDPRFTALLKKMNLPLG
jgi:serine/threonine-protein kinase